MSSSQPGRDSLVAGLWESWFRQLGQALRGVGGDVSVADFFLAVKKEYHEQNAYELVNKIKDLAYPSIGAYADFDPYHADLMAVVTTGEGGSPDFEGLGRLQQDYKVRHSTARVCL